MSTRAPFFDRSLVIRTPRLTLRALREDDRAQFISVHERSWSTHLGPWSPRLESEDFGAFFEQCLARSEDGFSAGSACRLVGFDEGGALVGGFNLNNVARGVFQNADAGWWVGVDHARRGLATEGVRALLDVAFAPFSPYGTFDGVSVGVGLHRVQCGIIPTNAPSLAVAAKAGFRREGIALRYLKIDGRWQDHVIFARTLEDHSGE